MKRIDALISTQIILAYFDVLFGGKSTCFNDGGIGFILDFFSPITKDSRSKKLNKNCFEKADLNIKNTISQFGQFLPKSFCLAYIISVEARRL